MSLGWDGEGWDYIVLEFFASVLSSETVLEPFNWTCGYCGKATTISEINYSEQATGVMAKLSKHGPVALKANSISCPNPDCLELTLLVELYTCAHNEFAGWQLKELIQSFHLLPASSEKPQPDYIPLAIRNDYYEACRILDDSPKASAAMARRCLQGIVRDFWDIPPNKRGNLGNELYYIKDQVQPGTWQLIQTIREVGDIGAHMEKDVNFIVEVERDEAELLVQLIETLFEDWYIARQSRLDRDAKVLELAQRKRQQRQEAKKAAKQANDHAGNGDSDE